MNILLIKLGALGDVLRTTPLLEGLRKKYPSSHITWLVDEPHRGVLENNPSIDRLFASSQDPDLWARTDYDLVINLDKEPEALDAFMRAKGRHKMGFGRDRAGALCAANPESDYALRLGLDDELKFRINQKTYQEISFEQVGLAFQGEDYCFLPDPSNLEKARLFLAGLLPKGSIAPIGLNTGAGTRFAGKRLPAESYRELGERLYRQLKRPVLLLGGQDELERNAWIEKTASVPLIHTGSHPIAFFAGLVSACDLVVAGDTTAMHIAIAMKVPVLTYFASTCAAEIELYGRGDKIVSTISCAPCYKKICPIDEKCMKEMDLDVFLERAEKLLKRHAIRIP